MKKLKVIYILNNAPDYRDKFLKELGKEVDLTVVAYPGAADNLKDPDVRKNYNFIPLKRMRFLGINFNVKEFTLAKDNYDVVIIGYSLRSPFRLLNLFRFKRVLAAGLIYGKKEGRTVKLLRKLFLNRSESVLVYTGLVKQKLEKEIKKPIYSFNNTYFYQYDINPLKLPDLNDKLHVFWVGRYQERKKIERLYELAKCDSRISIVVAGPSVPKAFKKLPKLPNFKTYEPLYGEELNEMFSWSHIIMNPGGCGLLAMNAARQGRGIIVDNNSEHGPEIQLAIDAEQFFIDFSDTNQVQSTINSIFNDPTILEAKAQLMIKEMRNYTIENMVKVYMQAIESVVS